MRQMIKVVGRFDRFDELREFVLDFVARMDGEYPEEMKLGQLGFQTRVGCGDRFHCCNWIKEGVKETDYSELLPELRGTVVEDLLSSMPTPLCRVRAMRLLPKYNYPVHVDPSPRIHVPIVTHEKCAMLYPAIEHMKQMPADGSIYWMDPRLPHTFVNWGNEPRIHLMGSLVDGDYDPN
jgi:hypothetical protein